jgi:hypothetical protein
MFDLWGTRKRREEELEQRRKKELHHTILAGQVRALLLVLGATIDLMPAQDRQMLVGVLKGQVSKGFGSEARGFDEVAKKFFNNSLSATLQNFIETIH